MQNKEWQGNCEYNMLLKMPLLADFCVVCLLDASEYLAL